MTTMNVSLPEQMKDWIAGKIELGEYHNVSEYIRDLIRKDQAEQEKIQAFRAAIDHGRASSVSERSFDEIIKDAKAKIK